MPRNTKGTGKGDKLKGLAGDLLKCAPNGHENCDEWVSEMMKFLDDEKLRNTDLDYRTAETWRFKLDPLSDACTKLLDVLNNLDDPTSNLIHFSAYSIGYTDDLPFRGARAERFTQDIFDQVRKLQIVTADAKDSHEAKSRAGNSSQRKPETIRKDRVAWMFANIYHAAFNKLPHQSEDSAEVKVLRLAFCYLSMQDDGAQRHLRNQVEKLRTIGK